MISIIAATRGRPHMMETMLKSAVDTSTEELECVWYIDDDDLSSQKKAEELNKYCPNKVLTRPRYSIPLSQTINECYPLSQGDIIFTGADDIVFKTQKWNEFVRKAYSKFTDRILLCGGYDGINHDLITHPFMSREWISAAQSVVPTNFRDCYVDTWLCEVAKMVGRIERLPIVIEHNHFSAGKMPMDKTATERMELIRQNDESAQIFFRTKPDRIEQAKRIYSCLKS